MIQEEIQIIIDSDLPSYEKSKLIQKLIDDKNKDVKLFQQGGNLPQTKTEIKIAGKTYNVYIAKSEEEKEIGLSQVDSLKDGEGMLFVYDEPQEDLWFTMADTSINLDIIFMDEEGMVTTVNHCKAMDPNPIPDTVGNAQYVLEVNMNSGIRPGDELEEVDDEELTQEEKEEAVKNSRMLVLDENGNVQMKLEGGERIFSRISTRKFIKAAIKAYRSDNDADYRKVGKLVFSELNAQDNRDPEYVEKK